MLVFFYEERKVIMKKEKEIVDVDVEMNERERNEERTFFYVIIFSQIKKRKHEKVKY